VSWREAVACTRRPSLRVFHGLGESPVSAGHGVLCDGAMLLGESISCALSWKRRVLSQSPAFPLSLPRPSHTLPRTCPLARLSFTPHTLWRTCSRSLALSHRPQRRQHLTASVVSPSRC
jgi:hypothetical protein